MDYVVKERDKKVLIKQLLEENECVLIFINTDNADLIVPERFTKSCSLTLQISLNFQGNMFITNDGINVDLIFDVDYEHCYIPWKALWGVRGEEAQDTYYFIDSIPKEIANDVIKAYKLNDSDEYNDFNNNKFKVIDGSESQDRSQNTCQEKSKEKSKESDKNQDNTKQNDKKVSKYPNFTVIK